MEDKQLREEAEEYSWNSFGLINNEKYLAFIAGTTSKYVEQEKLKFAMGLLNKIKEAEIYDKIKYIESSEVDYQIMKLQQQLKELVKTKL